MTEADPTGGEITEAEVAAMLRAVIKLFRHWRVTDAQARVLLGQPSASTYDSWTQGKIESVPPGTIARLAELLGIHKALRCVFIEPEQGYRWIKRPNDAFRGRSALDRMLDGAPGDIAAVRSYLDGQWDNFFDRPGIDMPDRRQPAHQKRERFE